MLSYRDAAALWGVLDLTNALIDVTVQGTSRSGPVGIRRHGARALASRDTTIHSGIPVTSVARTLLDLAGVVSPRMLQRAFEQAARLGILDLAALAELLSRSRGKKGARKLRRLLDYDPGPAKRAKSELELMFADLIRASEIPMFEPNAQVAGEEVDAYWADVGLIVELDSRSFHSNPFEAERDDTKTAKLRLAGLEVIRVTYNMVRTRPQWVLDAVRTMRSRAETAKRHA